MTILEQISIRIIKEQELVIGPLAWEEAKKVPGLKVIDPKQGEVTVEGSNAKEILNNLVARYARLFGRASNEVCKEAAHDLIAELSKDQVPSSLQ